MPATDITGKSYTVEYSVDIQNNVGNWLARKSEAFESLIVRSLVSSAGPASGELSSAQLLLVLRKILTHHLVALFGRLLTSH